MKKKLLMKKIVFVLGLVILLTGFYKKTYAQYNFYNDNYYYTPIIYEVGASVGVMNSLTDLGGKAGIGKRFVKDLNYGNNSFTYGAYFSVLYKNAFGLRFEAALGKVSADDAILENIPTSDIANTRFNRNVNFQSKITEYSLITEIHPLFVFINWDESESEPPRYSPYLLGGVGYFSFNPQTKLGNKIYDLQPLCTEGQGFKEYSDRPTYKLKQMNYPVGGGLKYEISNNVNIRGEFVYRILKTDYLDDVSTTYVNPDYYVTNGFTGTKLQNALLLSDRQINKVTGPGGKRGSPTEKDSYFSFNIKVGITFGRERVN